LFFGHFLLFSTIHLKVNKKKECSSKKVKHFPSIKPILCQTKPCKRIAIFPASNPNSKYFSKRFPTEFQIDLLEHSEAYLSSYKEYYAGIP
jgi:hypothetical protein